MDGVMSDNSEESFDEQSRKEEENKSVVCVSSEMTT